MTASDFSDLSDGASLYLVPVGPVFGDRDAVNLADTGIQFAGFRVIVRENGDILYDQRHRTDEFEALKSNACYSLAHQIDEQLSNLATPRKPIPLAGLDHPIIFSKPLIMGVLNVTPDSFSDGGKYLDPVHAVTQARRMIAEGADIIDIGGESTRPGAETVWEGEEAERVVPVIEALKNDRIPLSIDTRHASVMEKALAAGVHIINDISALTYDPESLNVAARSEAPIVLMHSQGEPKTMQNNPLYRHVLLDVYDYLRAQIGTCEAAGIHRDRLIVDPGIGFGKRMVQDNMALINGLPLFHTLGCAILFGASRKSFIGAVSGVENASDRLPGSLAAAIKGVEAGVQIVRVHDVAETSQAVAMTQGFRDAAIIDALN